MQTKVSPDAPALKCDRNALASGARPRGPAGELTALPPHLLAGLGEGKDGMGALGGKGRNGRGGMKMEGARAGDGRR